MVRKKDRKKERKKQSETDQEAVRNINKKVKETKR